MNIVVLYDGRNGRRQSGGDQPAAKVRYRGVSRRSAFRYHGLVATAACFASVLQIGHRVTVEPLSGRH